MTCLKHIIFIIFKRLLHMNLIMILHWCFDFDGQMLKKSKNVNSGQFTDIYILAICFFSVELSVDDFNFSKLTRHLYIEGKKK